MRIAQRIETRATFDDVVLPSGQSAMLRDIARQLRQRERVYREWGFGAKHQLGQGLVALFAGESGTGKTLAAEVIASELDLDLYRIDLATVVSKYIGETEKNLQRLFDAAEASGAVLLFDEADALFGKRSEVKDSHDRYANIEVAYLLQRMEAYRGLAMLTTNMKSALDQRLPAAPPLRRQLSLSRRGGARADLAAAVPAGRAAAARSISRRWPGSTCPAATSAASPSMPPSRPPMPAPVSNSRCWRRPRTKNSPSSNARWAARRWEAWHEAQRPERPHPSPRRRWRAPRAGERACR